MKKINLVNMALLSLIYGTTSGVLPPLYQDTFWGGFTLKKSFSDSSQIMPGKTEQPNEKGVTPLMHALNYETICSYKTDGESPLSTKEFEIFFKMGGDPLVPLTYRNEGETNSFKDHFDYHRYCIDTRLANSYKGSWCTEQQRMAELYLFNAIYFLNLHPMLPIKKQQEILGYAKTLASKEYFPKIGDRDCKSYKDLLDTALKKLNFLETTSFAKETTSFAKETTSFAKETTSFAKITFYQFLGRVRAFFKR